MSWDSTEPKGLLESVTEQVSGLLLAGSWLNMWGLGCVKKNDQIQAASGIMAT